MFFYVLHSGQIRTVTDNEHSMIRQAKAQGKTFFDFPDGSGFAFSAVSSVMTQDQYDEREREILKKQGKKKCLYGATHWLAERCECRPLPGESSPEDLKAFDKKFLSPALAEKKNKLLSGMSMPSPTYLDQLQARAEGGEKRAKNILRGKV